MTETGTIRTAVHVSQSVILSEFRWKTVPISKLIVYREKNTASTCGSSSSDCDGGLTQLLSGSGSIKFTRLQRCGGQRRWKS